MTMAGPLGLELEAQRLAQEPDEVAGVGRDLDAQHVEAEPLERVGHQRHAEAALVGELTVEEDEMTVRVRLANGF